MDRTTAPNSKNGAFLDSNVATGKPGTTLLARDLTAHQEEIMSVLEETGINPDSGDFTQLLQGIMRVVGIITAPLSAMLEWRAYIPIPGNSAGSFCYGNGLFILGTALGKIYTSSDAITWTLQAELDGYVACLVYGNGLYVAGTNNANESLHSIYTSSDGITWTQRVSGIEHDITHLVYGNGIYMAGVNGSSFYVSSDGISWEIKSTINVGLYALIYGGGLFVATGGSSGSSPVYTIYTSPDGVTWTDQGNPKDGPSCLAYGNGVYVLVSDDSKYYTSKDGMSWTGGQQLEEIPRSICYGRGIFVLSTYGNNIYTSVDGTYWTKRFEGSFPIGNLMYGRGVFLGSNSTYLFTPIALEYHLA